MHGWIKLPQMNQLDDKRIVLVHDWLTGMRGGEKCLEVACRRWHDAPLFTLLHRRGSVTPVIENRALHLSWLQRFPQVPRYYRYLLPLMPAAARSWRVPRCDLVLSFSHCVAKAARHPEGAVHVCYCFTPMRYAWHMHADYFGQSRGGLSFATNHFFEWLRHWDRQTANRVDFFIAISRTVQRRIEECYNRSSIVIYPPVDTDFYCPAPAPREDYYLVVSAFAPYKRLDLAIEACNRLKRKLVIIGTGQTEARLRALAGATIHFLGWQPNEVVRDHLRRCRALLFPGEEDFGIVPVEAQACGAPVIAFGKGGATETVMPAGSHFDPTGLFFMEPTAESLIDAIEAFETESADFHVSACRRQALRFNFRRFSEELFGNLEQIMQTSGRDLRQAA
jgi:glycosyltransferase involved in cell wall biosynthesis